jgi:hypothetical protein
MVNTIIKKGKRLTGIRQPKITNYPNADWIFQGKEPLRRGDDLMR